MSANLRAEMIYYTYAYLREDRTPYYIGKGKGNRAYRRSKTDIKPPKDKSRILILKKNLTEEESFRHEVYMIVVFGRKDLGTGILHNKTDGGEGASNPSQETRRKLSELNKGKTLSEKHKLKIGEANKNPSKESRKKMSEAQRGRTHSDESKRKMSEVKKGKPRSEETKRKMIGVGKGRTHSEETKRKMSEAGKCRTHSKETKQKLSELKKGNKWWNNRKETKLCINCPGDGWVLGRIK
jgi:hypothetical protein